jgi:hypothetical protein
MIEVLKQMQKALREYHYYTIDAGLPNQSMLNKGYAAYQAGLKAIAELESQEHNFCPRCGKRTNDIHTCTPPPPEQEPWCMKMNGCTAKCEDCPDEPPPTPQRTWVGLTDEEIKTICVENGWDSSWQSMRFSHAIEAKLKQKNGFAEEKNT